MYHYKKYPDKVRSLSTDFVLSPFFIFRTKSLLPKKAA